MHNFQITSHEISYENLRLATLCPDPLPPASMLKTPETIRYIGRSLSDGHCLRYSAPARANNLQYTVHKVTTYAHS